LQAGYSMPNEINRLVAQADAIEIILHLTEYPAAMGGIFKGKD